MMIRLYDILITAALWLHETRSPAGLRLTLLKKRAEKKENERHLVMQYPVTLHRLVTQALLGYSFSGQTERLQERSQVTRI